MAYADDLVMMAEGEDEIKSMIKKLEGYLDEKGLEVNTEKTKIMRFRKGGGRLTRKEWKWKGERIEEMKEYKYVLGICVTKEWWSGSVY